MDKKMSTMKATMGKVVDMPGHMMPSFSLTEKDLPEIKNWKVGKKYKLDVEVEQVSMEKDEYVPGKPMMARFRILKVKEGEEYKDEAMRGKMGHM